MRAAAIGGAMLALLAAPAIAAADDATCPDADVVISADTAQAGAGAIVCLIDAWRAEGGAVALHRSSQLDLSSQRQSRDMVARHYLAHQRRNGPSVLDRIRATGYFDNAVDGLYSENIGVVPQETATARNLVGAWLSSPDHRDNIEEAAFRDIGVGIAFAPPDRAFYPDYASVVVTTDFGQRSLRPQPKRHAVRCSHKRGRPRRARPYCKRRRS